MNACIINVWGYTEILPISALWTLCDTGKLFIFRIAGQSLRFQSRIDGEMVPCDWLRDGQRFKILKTQNLAAFLLEHTVS